MRVSLPLLSALSPLHLRLHPLTQRFVQVVSFMRLLGTVKNLYLVKTMYFCILYFLTFFFCILLLISGVVPSLWDIGSHILFVVGQKPDA